jgi:hypothetical protein
MDICEPHRKHLFLSRCIYSALHSNGNCPIVACILSRDCVYRVVAQQRVYMSQYIYSVTKKFRDLMELVRHRITKALIEQYVKRDQFKLQPHSIFPMFLFKVIIPAS